MKILLEAPVKYSEIGSLKRDVVSEVQELLDMCSRLEKRAASIAKDMRRRGQDLMGDVKSVTLAAGSDDDEIDEAFDELQTIQDKTESTIEQFRQDLEDLAEDVYLG